MLKAELKVTGGTHAGKSIPLAKQRFLIGRGDDCQLRPASEQISRHHCVFSIDDFTVRLRDLGSTNGTFVNGEQLHGELVLKHGDTVRVGSLQFEMQISNEQVSYQAGTSSEQTLLPKEVTEVTQDTAELSASETSLDLPASRPGEQPAGDAAATDSTVIMPTDPSSATVELPDAPAVAPEAAVPPQPAAAQPSPGMMPYPPQPGYPYPGQPAMGYPQQPYPYPGYMPMPAAYPPQQPMPYPQAPPQYAATEEPGAATAAAGDAAGEMPVKLPPPESTGAKAPEVKPPAAEGEAAPEATSDPSSMAAAAIKNMRNHRPSSS